MGFTGTVWGAGALGWGPHHVGFATSSRRAEWRLWEMMVRLGSNTFNFCISSVIAQNTSVPVLQPESAQLHHWQYWSWPAVVLVVSWVSVVPLVLRSKGRAERGLCTFICCTRDPCVCDFPLCPSLQVLRQVMAEVSVKTNFLHYQLLQTTLTMGDVRQT